LREWGENGRQRDREKQTCSQVVSDRYYYAYHLYIRDGLTVNEVLTRQNVEKT